jgi:protein gp37
MAIKSGIEWTESTWNPLTGCTKISIGCKYCYAERMAIRLQAMKQPNYSNGFQLTIHERALELPLRWTKPQVIFVNSMSDLFHEDVPDEFILQVFNIMNIANWHQFQVLTKRSDRLLEMSSKLSWPVNVWMGVSVETNEYSFRIDHLRQTGAKIKFISLEPLLGSMPNLNLEGINWVVVGGESGPKARPIEKSWVIDIRDQCLKTRVPFFFKQWGGVHKKKSGRELEGRVWNELPITLTLTDRLFSLKHDVVRND